MSHIEFDANYPPQVYLENDKSSLGAKGSHYYNIFSESADSLRYTLEEITMNLL